MQTSGELRREIAKAYPDVITREVFSPETWLTPVRTHH